MEMVVITEIWQNNKIVYMPVIIEGLYYPKQDDMTARDKILASLVEQNTVYNFLDITGLIVKEQLVWKD